MSQKSTAVTAKAVSILSRGNSSRLIQAMRLSRFILEFPGAPSASQMPDGRPWFLKDLMDLGH